MSTDIYYLSNVAIVKEDFNKTSTTVVEDIFTLSDYNNDTYNILQVSEEYFFLFGFNSILRRSISGEVGVWETILTFDSSSDEQNGYMYVNIADDRSRYPIVTKNGSIYIAYIKDLGEGITTGVVYFNGISWKTFLYDEIVFRGWLDLNWEENLVGMLVCTDMTLARNLTGDFYYTEYANGLYMYSGETVTKISAPGSISNTENYSSVLGSTNLYNGLMWCGPNPNNEGEFLVAQNSILRRISASNVMTSISLSFSLDWWSYNVRLAGNYLIFIAPPTSTTTFRNYSIFDLTTNTVTKTGYWENSLLNYAYDYVMSDGTLLFLDIDSNSAFIYDPITDTLTTTTSPETSDSLLNSALPCYLTNGDRFFVDLGSSLISIYHIDDKNWSTSTVLQDFNFYCAKYWLIESDDDYNGCILLLNDNIYEDSTKIAVIYNPDLNTIVKIIAQEPELVNIWMASQYLPVVKAYPVYYIINDYYILALNIITGSVMCYYNNTNNNYNKMIISDLISLKFKSNPSILASIDNNTITYKGIGYKSPYYYTSVSKPLEFTKYTDGIQCNIVSATAVSTSEVYVSSVDSIPPSGLRLVGEVNAYSNLQTTSIFKWDGTLFERVITIPITLSNKHLVGFYENTVGNYVFYSYKPWLMSHKAIDGTIKELLMIGDNPSAVLKYDFDTKVLTSPLLEVSDNENLYETEIAPSIPIVENLNLADTNYNDIYNYYVLIDSAIRSLYARGRLIYRAEENLYCLMRNDC